MSKIRKIAVSIIIGIIAILGIYNVSNAYEQPTKVGDQIWITISDYYNDKNLFCMEHKQGLYSSKQYKVISNVKIEGIKSTDHEGKVIENKSNARLAYILSQDNGNYKTSGQVANAIWNYASTWMKEVGQYHAGLYLNFASSTRGSTTSLDTEAQQYADNISKGITATDNTDKSKIKVQAYEKDGKQYMRVGPFNWTFGGTLTEVSIYDQNSKEISGQLYSTFSGNTEKWISAGEIKSGSNFYISVPINSGVTKITKVTGKMIVDVKAVNIWFLKSDIGFLQNLIIREPDSDFEPIDSPFDYDIPCLGNLKVIKVNKDNKTVKLPNVGFKIQNKDTKKWIKEANGIISYVDSKDKATEFITDKNGEITIKDLIVGTYAAYETKNPNYGYEIINDGAETKVIVNKTAELEIENKQKYIKLSGYVWVDNVSGKQSTRNDLYKDGTYDSDDILLDGITVNLKDKSDTSGKPIMTAKTANGGAYQFIDVLVDDLDKYYVEFEYNGLTYTNVVSHIDKDNGSKSAENSTVREDFNKGFSSVVGGKTSNTGVTLDEGGNPKNDLTYNLTYDANNGAKSELLNNGLYPITANTNETGYSIKAHFTPGQEEIKYINLGLYEREQPDISLVKDLYNVKVSINGYNHVYEYNQRFDKPIEPTEDDLNVGVKYKNSFTREYGAPIYEADYNYKAPDGKNELEVYVTYQLRINNESSSLITRVNSIVDYYDQNYELYSAGTSINQDDKNVSGNITYEVDKLYNKDGYKKATINLDINADNNKIEHGKYADIYVQFKLDKQAVLNILNNKENLDNVAEINSYSVFNEKGIYAGIDKDSNPGNANPADVTTHQDDTSSAPGLLLEVVLDREMTGKVFLDESTGGVGVVREGDGKYTDNEKGISGVTVTLTETSGSGKVYTATTAENGDFYISDYIPGDYTLTYTWGGQTYTLDNKQYTITVQDYKGTIYKDRGRANNKEWYKTTEPRYSDAIDDYGLRQEIDAKTKETTGATTTTIHKMDSTTPTMGIGIDKTTDGNTKFGITTVESMEMKENKFVPKNSDFKVINIDFGIVERAKQEIDISKRVSGFKVTLANGQVVADVTIDENGEKKDATGQNYVTYTKPSESSSPSNGSLWLQLDNELIQGAKVEVTYQVTVKNNSELDYDTENYYLYGIVGSEDDIIGIQPAGVYDYLDSKLPRDTTKDNDEDGSSKWSVVSENSYSYSKENPTIIDTWFNDYTKIDDDGNIVIISESGGNSYKEIVTEWKEELIELGTTEINDVKLANKTILENAKFQETELIPIEGKNINSATLYASKVLANTDEIDLNNDAEITEVRRTSKTGREITPVSSTFYNRAETIIVTPPTGQNQNYIAIIATTISALVILGAGVVLIRKNILGNK